GGARLVHRLPAQSAPHTAVLRARLGSQHRLMDQQEDRRKILYRCRVSGGSVHRGSYESGRVLFKLFAGRAGADHEDGDRWRGHWETVHVSGFHGRRSLAGKEEKGYRCSPDRTLLQRQSVPAEPRGDDPTWILSGNFVLKSRIDPALDAIIEADRS